MFMPRKSRARLQDRHPSSKHLESRQELRFRDKRLARLSGPDKYSLWYLYVYGSHGRLNGWSPPCRPTAFRSNLRRRRSGCIEHFPYFGRQRLGPEWLLNQVFIAAAGPASLESSAGIAGEVQDPRLGM